MASVASEIWLPFLWRINYFQNVDRNGRTLHNVMQNRSYHKLILTNRTIFPKYSAVESNPANIKVRAGSSTYKTGGELYAVKRIVLRKFNSSSVDFDISLLELQKPIQFDETKRAIKLHNFDDVFPDNTTTLVSGWGNTRNSSESRLNLRAGKT